MNNQIYKIDFIKFRLQHLFKGVLLFLNLPSHKKSLFYINKNKKIWSK